MSDADRAKKIRTNQAAWQGNRRADLDFTAAPADDFVIEVLESRKLVGLLPSMDVRVLVALAKRNRVTASSAIEVGRFAGYSTALLSLCGFNVWSIDLPRDRLSLRHHTETLDARYPGWVRIRDCAEQSMQAVTFKPPYPWRDLDSRDGRAWPPDRDYDLAFIDGGHSAEVCFNDLNHSWWRLRPGGIMAAHDYDLAITTDPTSGVDVAWDWWLTRCRREGAEYHGPYAYRGSSIVWVVKPEINHE